ncbi:hypothetical protein ABIE33_003402 [Ensifer sp. 4252]
MGQTVEARGRHLGIAEHCRPLSKGQVRGDDDRSALVQPADQMEQELAACLRKWQIAEFVENDEVESIEIIDWPPLLAAMCLRFQADDQIDDIEESPPVPLRISARPIATTKASSATDKPAALAPATSIFWIESGAADVPISDLLQDAESCYPPRRVRAALFLST